MEKVIQMYLRNEYETITEYNLKAGNIAEKYHFLVIADFPSNFSEQAIRGLLKIAASGARCGIYTIMQWDKRASAPEAFLPEEMRKHSLVIEQTKKGAFRFVDGVKKGCTLSFDPPPSDAIATEYVKLVGDASDDSNRIEVPFSHIAPPELWQRESTKELAIPIGRSGATKLQELAFGKGTRQHALIAGKTGSGKSTLFHVVITNMALHFSPDEVQFYLVDFKKGVEFKAYGNKKLPHAKVIAIESDREFGLSVLQRLDDELKKRGELFRNVGSQDVAGFRKAVPDTPMPRILLMIDEFQEYFVEDDKIAQQAGVLLDRIVRQGRAFGIHVFLGSQTLGGAYSLARATLGQMVIRIALMCNEADALLIMDEGNSAPQLLTRPGEGIYNDGAGALENNSPFQTVWLDEEERDKHLDAVNAMLEKTGREPGSPIVFEGNAPSDVTENLLLAKLRKAEPASPPSPKIWLGAPNAIKGPTEVTFHRQSGNHLLVVGQRDDAVLAMFGIAPGHPLRAVRCRRREVRCHRRFAARLARARVARRRHRLLATGCRHHLAERRRRTGRRPRHGAEGAPGILRRRLRTADLCLHQRRAEIQEAALRRGSRLLLRRLSHRGEPGDPAHRSDRRGLRFGDPPHHRDRLLQQPDAHPQPEGARRVRDARAVPDERQRQRRAGRLDQGRQPRHAPRAVLQRARRLSRDLPPLRTAAQRLDAMRRLPLAVLFCFACTLAGAEACAEVASLKPKYGIADFETQWSRTAPADRPAAIANSRDAAAKGWKALRASDVEVAIKRFNQAWTLWEDNASALWGMALIVYERTMAMEGGSAEQALKGFDQAIALMAEARDLDPKRAPLLVDLALLHATRGGFRKHAEKDGVAADFTLAETALITAERISGPHPQIESTRETLERYRGNSEAADIHAIRAKELREAAKNGSP